MTRFKSPPIRKSAVSLTSGIACWLGVAAFALAAEPSTTNQIPQKALPKLEMVSIQVTAADDWNAKFRQSEGWLGADGAYSARLADGRLVWIFNDTFIGSQTEGKRKNTVMVNSSLGLQPAARLNSPIEFMLRSPAATSEKQSPPQNWFISPAASPENKKKRWLWPQGAIEANERLYVFCQQVEQAQGGSEAFGFQIVGTELHELSELSQPPAAWRTKAIPLAITGLTKNISTTKQEKPSLLTCGAAVISHAGWIYIYSIRETPGDGLAPKQLLLVRVRPEQMNQPTRWEYFTKDKWQPVTSAAEPNSILEGITSELSVSYDSLIKQWIMVSSEGFLGPHILLRTAPSPEGPWSKAEKIYLCPEAAWKKELFCYAAKGHAALSAPGELLISYVANSHHFGDTINDARLYWPTFIRVKMQPLK